jgi:hypothetical protein
MPICAPEKVDGAVKSHSYWDSGIQELRIISIKEDKCQNRPTNPKTFVGRLSAAETADNPFALI